MSGGFTGEGIKTVIPARASAKISCRLVPKQTPADILDKVCTVNALLTCVCRKQLAPVAMSATQKRRLCRRMLHMPTTPDVFVFCLPACPQPPFKRTVT